VLIQTIAVQFLTGLSGAASLFLVAAGLTVIFGVTRVVNFAHGSLAMLGAYFGWTILRILPHDPASFALGIILAALATALCGVVIERLVLRRLYGAPELFQLLATFGVVLIIQDATLAIWGPEDLALPRPPWLRAGIALLGTRFPRFDLVLIAIGPLVLLALWALLARTAWGRQVRAATENRAMLAALGVNERALSASVFALGAALAGLGGALSLPDHSANLGIDLDVVVNAFVVVVVGGLGSIGGAFLASLLIALLQAFGVLLLPKATLALSFIVMAVVLALRPHGLLGRPPQPRHGAAERPMLLLPAPIWQRRAAWMLVLVALAAPFLVGPFALSIMTEALVAILFAASLHLAMGPGGMPSFGHAAWFGLGAYGSALATTRLDWPLLLALLAGVGLALVGALLLAGFVARRAGVYLAMLSLAFAQIVWAVAFQWVDLTGGDNGLLAVRTPLWPGRALLDGPGLYWLALVLCLGGALALRRVTFSRFGYALRAGRDSPARAAAIGLDVARLRLAAFTLAGAAAGLSGSVFAYAKGAVFPSYLAIPHSVDALLMVLLGGVQAASGPLIGAVSYTVLYDGLLRVTDLWRAALGVAIIALVLAFPNGLAGRRDAA
jgi:branched-chain amino acid transport system permease protein